MEQNAQLFPGQLEAQGMQNRLAEYQLNRPEMLNNHMIKAYAPEVNQETGTLYIPTYNPNSNMAGWQTIPGAPRQLTETDKRRQALEQEQKLADIAVKEATDRARAANKVEQEKKDISDGMSAAQTYPILVRSEELLDIVETGIPEDILFGAQRLLGINTADKEELEQLLGKQIIKQLKPTFGAQFTKAEGDWLKSMEAHWGKSTKGNRRLVRQGMLLVQRRAKIGIAAANSAGDLRVAQDMKDWLEFRIDNQPFDGVSDKLSAEEEAELRELEAWNNGN